MDDARVREIRQQIERESAVNIQPQLDAFDKASQRSFFRRTTDFTGSAVSGTARGVFNAGADVVDTITDVGFMAGVAGADKLVGLFDREIDEDQVLKDLQGFRDGMTSYIRSEESDDGVRNFMMNATESVAKYAYFYKKLAKAGVGKIGAVTGAGFAEGFTDQPDKDLMVLDKTIRAGIGAINPDGLADWDKAMDVNTDPDTAKQLTRRVMSGIEVGMLSLVGEGIVKGAGAAAGTTIKHIPDTVKQPVIDAFGKVMERSVAAKRYVSNKISPVSQEKLNIDEALKEFAQEKPKIAYVQKNFDIDKPAAENLNNTIGVGFDPHVKTLDAESYTKTITAYEAKLDEIAPQLFDDVVSFSKAKGLVETEKLDEYARALGIKETEDLTVEKFKNALRAQAHNRLFEQQLANYAISENNLLKGVITQDEYYDTVKSFWVAAGQREALFSGAGATLGAARSGLNEGLMDAAKSIKQARAELNPTLEAYNKTLQDPEALIEMSKILSRVAKEYQMYGGTMESIDRAFKSGMSMIDPAKPAKYNATEIATVMTTTYTAGMLSGLTTLMQNSFGAAFQMTMQASDTFVKAGISKVRGRQVGDPTFNEAAMQFQGIWTGHLNALALSIKAGLEYTKKDGARNVYSDAMKDIPQMVDYQRQNMFRINKEDMTISNGALNDRIAKNTLSYILSGQPVFTAIALQDMTMKSISAKSFLDSKWKTALYTDDIFNIKETATNLTEARKIYTQKYMTGVNEFTKEEVERAGIKNEIEATLLLKQWRSKTGAEASDYALESAMQQKLNPAMEQLGNVLQSFGGKNDGTLASAAAMVAGRTTVPFFQTPVNIISDGLMRTPLIPIGEEGELGLPIHPRFYADFYKGGKAREEAIARLTTGTVLAQLGATLYEQGHMTPAPLGSRDAATLDSAIGVPPNSINIFGENIPLVFLGAGALSIGAGAQNAAWMEKNMYRKAHLKEEDIKQIEWHMLARLGGLMQIVKEAPFMMGFDQINEFVSADYESIKDLGSGFGKEFGKRLGNFMPYSSLQRQAAQHLMEEQTRANTFTEHVLSSFYPYANQPAYNVWGEPQPTNPRFAFRGKPQDQINRTAEAAYTMSGVELRALKFEQSVKIPEGGSVKINLIDDTWVDFNKFYRETNIEKKVADFLKTDFAMQNFSTDNLSRNAKEIEGYMRQSRDLALQRVIEKYPYLRQDIEKQKRLKRGEEAMRPTPPAGSARRLEEFRGNM